jgi:hypothetical protein
VLETAELDACLALGARAVEAGANQVVGAVRDVRAQFLVNLAGGAVTMKQTCGKRAEPGKRSH